jgi:hypothetical protein
MHGDALFAKKKRKEASLRTMNRSSVHVAARL